MSELTKDTETDALTKNENLFTVRNLIKKFSNGFEAICGIDLDIYKGECLLIAGSNGSGKSVLMRMLAGLTEPTGGTILYRGKLLMQWGRELRGQIGLVFQDPDAQIIGETVEEDIKFGPQNLGLPKIQIDKTANVIMEKFGLISKKDFSPRRLSGGEKRRLALAGILAMGCDTVIMDEPFANLDWPGVVQVLGAVREIKAAGKTIILLTHELEKVLALADRLVILDRGMIRGCGVPAEVLDRMDNRWGVRDPRRSYLTVSDCCWL
ncbi:MAG: energy-coupling factor ABC transporter ATP-binding protein [Treponema sp.]|nr:energy-coupling factor ABC transporter ATP-binding protein [Treponema sp.]